MNRYLIIFATVVLCLTSEVSQAECYETSFYIVDRALVDEGYRAEVADCHKQGLKFCYRGTVSPARDQGWNNDNSNVAVTAVDLRNAGLNPKNYAHEAICTKTNFKL